MTASHSNPNSKRNDTPAREDNPNILWAMIAARDVQIAEMKAKLAVVEEFAVLLSDMTSDREDNWS